MVDEIIKKIEKSKKSAGAIFFIWGQRSKFILRNRKFFGHAQAGRAARFYLPPLIRKTTRDKKKVGVGGGCVVEVCVWMIEKKIFESRG